MGAMLGLSPGLGMIDSNSSNSGFAEFRSQMAEMNAIRAADQRKFEQQVKEERERAEAERKRWQEMYKKHQQLEKEKNKLVMQMATMESKREILKAKQDSLVVVKEELSKVAQSYTKQEKILNSILLEINTQSHNISRKWLNTTCIESKVDENEDEIITPGETHGENDDNDDDNNNNDDETKDFKLDHNNYNDDDGDETHGENNDNDDNNNNDDDDEKHNNNNNNDDNLDVLNSRIDLLQGKLKSMRVVICIGKTGLGKSTFLNRFMGDKSDEGDEGGKNNKLFKVGHNVHSETSDVCHKFIKHIYDNKLYCVVDTPGSSDSYGRDNEHTNNIAEYIRGCGGVNAFLIFINLADARVDIEYIKLLKLYNNMLSNDDNNNHQSDLWWKHVIIIGTNYDLFLFKEKNKLKRMNQSDREDYLKGRANEIINLFRSKKELGIPKNVPIPLIPIGHDNYSEAIETVLSNIQPYKFVCDKIVSPLYKLKFKVAEEESKLKDIKLELNKIEMRKTRIEEEIEFVSKQIETISQSIQQQGKNDY